MDFARGDIVFHKIMGKGVVLGKNSNDETLKVRMKDGRIENLYPEELEPEEIVISKQRKETEEVMKANEERAKKWRIGQ